MPTFEEIQEELQKSPEIKNNLLAALETDALGYLKTKGHIVRTTEEENTFLKNYETQKIDPRIKQVYDSFDRDIEETTGLKKPDGKKTYEHLKEILKDFSAKSQRAKDLEAEIEALKAGKGDELTKQQLKQLQDKIAEKENEKNALEESHKKALFGLKLETSLEKALAGSRIFVPAHVPDTDKDAYVNSRLAYIKSDFAKKFTAEETENGIVFKNSEGVIQINTTSAAPKTEAELLAENYKFEFEQEANPLTGAGSKGKGKGTLTAEKAGIKDKAGIYEYAAKQGLVQGSKEWYTEVQNVAKELNITI